MSCFPPIWCSSIANVLSKSKHHNASSKTGLRGSSFEFPHSVGLKGPARTKHEAEEENCGKLSLQDLLKGQQQNFGRYGVDDNHSKLTAGCGCLLLTGMEDVRRTKITHLFRSIEGTLIGMRGLVDMSSSRGMQVFHFCTAAKMRPKSSTAVSQGFVCILEIMLYSHIGQPCSHTSRRLADDVLFR